MNDSEIEKRKPVWLALSRMYLDTELQQYDIDLIIDAIKESPFSLEEVMTIDKYEVFPVLYQNLMSVAGVWNAFEESWLVNEILPSLNKRNTLRTFIIKVIYVSQKAKYRKLWMNIAANMAQCTAS